MLYKQKYKNIKMNVIFNISNRKLTKAEEALHMFIIIINYKPIYNLTIRH